MKFQTTFLVAALGLTNQALACVQFSAEANEYNFLTGNLQDNGGTPCTVSSYGDDNGWGKSFA